MHAYVHTYSYVYKSNFMLKCAADTYSIINRAGRYLGILVIPQYAGAKKGASCVQKAN